MNEKLALYRCKYCGKIVQVLNCGEGTLVCCNNDMEKIEPNTQETMLFEKHIPVFEQHENKTLIKIGSEPHPMTEEHYIQFAEVISKDKNQVYIKFLYPNETPELELSNNCQAKCAIEYCNIHGLFKGEN